MNSTKLRADFPILSGADNQQLIYLDSAATSQKPQAVIDAMSDFYAKSNASPHRGIYPLAENATQLYAAARSRVAQFINAAHDEEIVFTSGTTAGCNMVAVGWAAARLKKGDEILISEVEHHANFLPWQRLAERHGFKLRFMDFDQTTFTMVDPVMTERTKLVALTHSSNVVGSVWDEGQLERVIENARAAGARVFLDAAQSVPHTKVDVQNLNLDFMAFSGHKMLGPTGVGVLYIKKELHDEVEPYNVGGSMVYSVTKEKSIWEQAPLKFEAGTVPVAQAIGLHAAIDYLDPLLKDDALVQHEAKLCSFLMKGLSEIAGLHIFGNKDRLKKHGHLVSFAIQGLHAHDLADILGFNGVALRAGHHCAQPLADLLGITASLRVSFYLYNTVQEVEAFLALLKEAVTTLRSIKQSGDISS